MCVCKVFCANEYKDKDHISTSYAFYNLTIFYLGQTCYTYLFIWEYILDWIVQRPTLKFKRV